MGSAGAELPDLQLPPLRGAGAHLPALRSWQRLLRRRVRIGRRESLRRAAARYQRTRRGINARAAVPLIMLPGSVATVPGRMSRMRGGFEPVLPP